MPIDDICRRHCIRILEHDEVEPGDEPYYTERFGHAVNLFCDGEKIYVVEPQNDQIIEWCRDQDYCGKAYMVKF